MYFRGILKMIGDECTKRNKAFSVVQYFHFAGSSTKVPSQARLLVFISMAIREREFLASIRYEPL